MFVRANDIVVEYKLLLFRGTDIIYLIKQRKKEYFGKGRDFNDGNIVKT